MRRALGVALILACVVPARAAVLVELFTSQGCSSCPPADALLAELAKDPNVVAIAYHVDYWDRQGWRDPFSSREATLRQMTYVHSMHLSSAYTPQIVVDGTREMIGSAGAVVRTAIGAASREAYPGSASIALRDGNAVVQVDAPRSGLVLVLVGLQNDASTAVGGGENSGLTIRNVAIARSIRRVIGIPQGRSTQTLPISGDRVVAVLQDPTTMRLYALASSR